MGEVKSYNLGMKQCIVCDSKIGKKKIYNQHTSNHVLYYLKQLLLGGKKDEIPFDGFVQICTACGHGVMATPPTTFQLEEYYKQQYWSTRPMLTDQVKITKDAFKQDLRAQSQIDFISAYADVNSIKVLLEIGAGPAFASLVLKERRNNSLVINVCEPGEGWREHYRENSIINISPYFPFESNQKFDYIHTSHWLEHMLDLKDTVIRLNRFLNPSGMIFVEVPNTEYQYWDLPLSDTPHIQFFTPSSLVKVFENHGFECLKVGTFGQTFYEKFKGVPLNENNYKESKNGFWIRSLFRKT